MPLIDDGFNAVRSEQVAGVVKPDQSWMWYLTLGMVSGSVVELRFPSESARDDFYKNLVTAMSG
jgi:hypothetical protein